MTFFMIESLNHLLNRFFQNSIQDYFIALFTIQSLQSSFTGNVVSAIDLNIVET